jgi:hypothetical protein
MQFDTGIVCSKLGLVLDFGYWISLWDEVAWYDEFGAVKSQPINL